MEALNRNPEAQASGERRCKALFGVRLRDGLWPPRSFVLASTRLGDFAGAKDGSQNVRDNNAAWVAGPGRICF